jgi:tRNA G18 (ribose-2'-O)-methylase SpoU
MRKLSLKELNRLDVESFQQKKKYPVILVLDNVRSALNIGSAFRTADAFALEEILLVGICARPPHREITKTAIGATESVKWIYLETVEEAITYIKEKSYQIIPVEQAEESTALQDHKINLEHGTALIFGNEVKGVSQAFMDVANTCLEIPQFGTKHSLNISVSVGIVSWYFVEKMMKNE